MVEMLGVCVVNFYKAHKLFDADWVTGTHVPCHPLSLMTCVESEDTFCTVIS